VLTAVSRFLVVFLQLSQTIDSRVLLRVPYILFEFCIVLSSSELLSIRNCREFFSEILFQICLFSLENVLHKFHLGMFKNQATDLYTKYFCSVSRRLFVNWLKTLNFVTYCDVLQCESMRYYCILIIQTRHRPVVQPVICISSFACLFLCCNVWHSAEINSLLKLLISDQCPIIASVPWYTLLLIINLVLVYFWCLFSFTVACASVCILVTLAFHCW